MKVLSWAGRHRVWVQLGSVALALVLLVGGLSLGMSGASGSAAPAGTSCPPDCRQPEVVRLTKHYVVGTVVEAVTPGRAIIRTNGGRFVVVDYDRATIVRRERTRAPVSALRRGTRVIILGSPREGRLHADVVTITGAAAAKQLPASATPATSP